MRTKKAVMLVVVMLSMLVVLSKAALCHDIPKINLIKVKRAPKIDGKLNDSCWKEAVKVPFALYKSGKPDNKTQAYITYDNSNLYIAFLCYEKHPEKLKAEMKPRDTLSWSMQDNVEIFLDPGHSLKTYYHFIIDAQGSFNDKVMRSGAADLSWNSSGKIATHISKDRWTAEISIPFSGLALLSNNPTNTWGINLCRLQTTVPEEEKNLSKGRHSSFSLVTGSSHQPKIFGTISFPGINFHKYAYRVESKITGFEGIETYILQTTIKNNTGRDRTLIVEVEDIPISGKRSITNYPFQIKNKQDEKLALKIKIDNLSDRRAVLRLKDAQTQEIYYTSQSLKSPSLLTAYMDKNYYTNEKDAMVVIESSVSGLKAGIELRDKGKVVFKKTKILRKEKERIPIKMNRISTGKYNVEITLLDKKGNVVSKTSDILTKLAPGKGSEVKIDQERGIVLVNNRPFFPMGFFPMRRPFQEKDFARIKKAGFNTVSAWYPFRNVTIEAGKQYLKLAEAHGIMVWNWLRRHGSLPSFGNPNFRSLTQKEIKDIFPEPLKKLKDSPALLSWMSLDEPNHALYRTKDKKGVVGECRQIYDLAKNIDPYHPVWINFCISIPDSKKWANTYDIGSVDTYWIPSKGQKPFYVADCTKKAFSVTEKYRKVLIIVPQAEVWSGSQRALTPKEQRCQTYLALIYGAKGIVYFYYPVHYKPMWEELTKLAGEINHLSPALLSLTPKQEIIVKQEGSSSPISAVIKRHKNKTYLITANSSQRKVKVNFQLEGLTSSSRIKGLFENRDIPILRDSFTDSYSKYQTHVYEITGMKSILPVKLNLELVSISKPIKTEKIKLEHKVKHNLIKTPGFETDNNWQFNNKIFCSYDDKIFHSGKRSIRIERVVGAPSKIQFMSDWITLESGKKYLLGGFIKAQISMGEKGPQMFLVNREGKIYGKGITVTGKSLYINPSGETEWTEFHIQLPISKSKTDVRIFCRLKDETTGTAWFDSLYLGEKKTTEEIVNLVKNSSFEDAANPGWPDEWMGYWNSGFEIHDRLIGDKNAGWEQDSSTFYHGSSSLKCQAVGDGNKYRIRTYYMRPAGIPVEEGQTYTLSVYLKADRDNLPAKIYIGLKQFWDLSGPKIPITTTWKRYTVTVKIPAGKNRAWPVLDLLGKGILWVDAVQFEKGGEATDYQP